MSHYHFTLDDHMIIQIGLELNKSRRSIAAELGVSHTAVNYEVRSNSVILEVVNTTRVNKPRILDLDLRSRRGRGEVPKKMLALARWQERCRRFAAGHPSYIAEVAHELHYKRLMSKKRGSPEQIAADLKKEGISVCAQTIYNWIKRSSRRKELEKRLRRRGRRYRYRTYRTDWNKTQNKVSIHDRPSLIELLVRTGDLEGDTLFGLDPKDRILSHVDRVTGVVSLSLVLGYNANKVKEQTRKDINRVFGTAVHSITYDNGPEFACWEKLEKELKVNVYFADSYSSYQRGRNENVNGLARDYFPKGTDFKKITPEELQEVEDILNSRSRKRYTWLSPIEVRDRLLALA